ncbi:phenylacetate--CoA ligase family protein [Actinocatenispora comari]|uniref:Phenylacetate-coenzyme A ligase n=1 Tax=Actinocatenispora comari TaxID=2807577 RepID=A0A8J4AGH6_9ACTN|nr:phenylacetate--CoA ligase [Actinocatenispora comari]GIL28233.1 phenylacetate-coenzyme A ligase [Actinocatenispora comari]
MIFDRAERMSTDERAALQQRRLRALVDRLLAADGLQADRLRAAGVTGGAELTLADLPRLPVVRKADLWERYPYGMLAVPRTALAGLHGSSGTSGRPTIVGYTESDLRLWGQVMARSLAGAGITPNSLIHNAYGYGLFTGGLGVDHGARALGATVLPISAGMTARQVRLITDLAPDALTCTPSYAVYLGEAFAAAGVGPDEISLTVGVHGAEPWTDAMRDKIEALLGIRALDIYGLSEIIGPGVACQTLDSGSWLHVQDDHFYVEALDPGGDAPVPDGELGELTFTTFTKQALPLLRYRTGDLARLDRTPSPDGRTSVKMSRIVGRADDMLVVRGVNVYPSEIESVLLADPAVAPQYLLVLDTRTAQTRLVVCGELAVDGDPAPVSERLSAALHERLGLRCEVRVGTPGVLPRTEVGKAVRLHRWESGEPPLPDLD